MMAWLKFFRIVNLPTVPGDVLVGAAGGFTAVSLLGETGCLWRGDAPLRIVAACVASCALYLFGLADNDIVGAKKDVDRPIPCGEISLTAARIARGACLAVAMLVAGLTRLPIVWWAAASVLLALMVAYNRTKISFLMGLCRGIDVLLGLAALSGAAVWDLWISDEVQSTFVWALVCLVGPSLLWTAYVTFVTWFSKGEETDPERKRLVGVLVGSLVYLQLAVLMVFALAVPQTNRLLLAGGVLLIVLRIMKRLMPKVSAS